MRLCDRPLSPASVHTGHLLRSMLPVESFAVLCCCTARSGCCIHPSARFQVPCQMLSVHFLGLIHAFLTPWFAASAPHCCISAPLCCCHPCKLPFDQSCPCRPAANQVDILAVDVEAHNPMTWCKGQCRAAGLVGRFDTRVLPSGTSAARHWYCWRGHQGYRTSVELSGQQENNSEW